MEYREKKKGNERDYSTICFDNMNLERKKKVTMKLKKSLNFNIRNFD